tara:strand:- start:19917 stop:20378 length:462 start_codon:yes stop_codon:yes gene_type:complete
MPCHSAIVGKNVTASPNDSVENVLKAIKKGNVKAASIMNDDGEFVGIFSLKVLLKNLIPVSVAMADGIQIDIKVQAAPGIAKRLGKVMPLPVSELMDRKPKTVLSDDPIWEGVGQLTKNGEPLCVIDDKGKYLGMITYESLVEDLQNMETTDS